MYCYDIKKSKAREKLRLVKEREKALKGVEIRMKTNRNNTLESFKGSHDRSG